MKRKRPPVPASLMMALIMFTMWGCGNVAYFGQAIVGHFRVMGSRTPIEKILQTDQLDNESKNKLRLVLEVRSFAVEALDLPDNKSYTVYAEIEREYIGWNVYCAPKFSVEPKKWCFPVAGCVVYRGYFVKQKALAFANRMEQQDFDVYIGQISAYSTLGWYDDPVLSTHLRLGTVRLAGLIIHELAHQKLYVKGNSRFNEGLAVAVERTGVLRWLKLTGRDDLIEQALKMWAKDDLRVTKMLKARSQLKQIYSSDLDSMSMAFKKDSLFNDLTQDLFGDQTIQTNSPKTRAKDFKLNNAYLVPIDTYYSLVPVFQDMLVSLDGNFSRFFEKVAKLGDLAVDEQLHEIEILQRREIDHN